MRRLFGIVLSLSVCWGMGAPYAAEPDVKTGPGEAKLPGEDAGKVLAELKARFHEHPCIRAEITSVNKDPFGERKRQGEMLIQVPQRFLRRFGPKGNPVSVWLLDGLSLRESSSAMKTVKEVDFSKAPRKLALLKAAITMDVDVLKEYFHLSLFRKSAGDAAEYRLVLTCLGSDRNPIEYKYIQARWTAGAPFFSEILRVPSSGEADRAVETFTDIEVVDKFEDADFKEPMLELKKVRTQAAKD